MRNDSPLVSIIIPVFNAEAFLGEALGSIIRQTYDNWEIIVIDDGSKDHSKKWIEQFPVTHYLYQSNAGPSAARNRGIELAKGNFIAFLDADDRWPENKLESQLSIFAESPTLDVVTGLIEFVFLNPEKMTHYDFQYENNRAVHVHLGAALFKSSAFREIGNFDETMHFSEDVDWFNRAKENQLSIRLIEEVSLYLNIHEDSMTYRSTIKNNGTLLALKMALDRRRKNGIAEVPQLSDYKQSQNPEAND